MAQGANKEVPVARFLSQSDDASLMHVGDIVTSFAVLEEILSGFLRELISEDEKVGNVLISNQHFHWKLMLVRSLCEVKMNLDKGAKRLFDDLDEINEDRNEIVHSLWVSYFAAGVADENVKPADWRKGGQHLTSGFKVEELDQVSDRIDKAIGGLLSTWRRYKEEQHNKQK